MDFRSTEIPEAESTSSNPIDIVKLKPPHASPKSRFVNPSDLDYSSLRCEKTLSDQSGTARLADEEKEQEWRFDSSPDRTSLSLYTPSNWLNRPVHSWCLDENTKPSMTSWSLQWPSNEDKHRERESKPSIFGLSDWLNQFKPSMVGAGLANLGYTCFLNAVLQCFTHTVPFVQGLQSCNHMMPCDCNREGFCLICTLRGHVELSLTSMGKVVYPLKFVDNLSYFSSSFRKFQQEDAHEFMQCFLHRLDSCYDDLKTNDLAMSSDNDNFVKQSFGGRLISRLRCCNCGHFSDTYEPSNDLSLEIEDVDTLPSALESFTKVEKIEDPELNFTCEKCKEKVSVEKQLMLDHAPSVAAFHLKRFKNYGSYAEKIDKHVEFPLELDLQPYTNGNQNNNVDLNYDLYAVVVHIKLSPTLGHYYCFIRSAPNMWHKLDDSKVTRVHENSVLSEEAYILFYAKQGTPWFSSLVETLSPPLDPKISNASPNSVLDNVESSLIFSQSPSVANSHKWEASKIQDPSAEVVSTESSYRSRREIEFNKNMSVEASSCYGNQWKAERSFTPFPPVEYNRDEKCGEVKNNADMNFTLQTRPGSPRRISGTKQRPEVSLNKSCKSPLNKDLEESKKKPTCKLSKKLPSSRGYKLFEAVTKGAIKKKRKRKRKIKRKNQFFRC